MHVDNHSAFSSSDNSPKWLDQFEELANRELAQGSSCEQVHPVIAEWFYNLMEGEPPISRDSVEQAMSCLATEVMGSTPHHMLDSLLQAMDEDELALWIEQILLVGRAMEMALNNGDLDDL